MDSRGKRGSESTARIEIEGLTGGRLEAIAALWKREGRQLTVRFGGSSMAPTILPGTEVILLCGVRPSPGEIAAFTFRERIIVHRVVARSSSGTWVLTRGDASVIPDPPILESALIGIVARIRRGDGFVAPAAPPVSRRRRIAATLCVLGMRAKPSAGHRLIGLLWFLRRWFVLAPQAAARWLGSMLDRRGH